MLQVEEDKTSWLASEEIKGIFLRPVMYRVYVPQFGCVVTLTW